MIITLRGPERGCSHHQQLTRTRWPSMLAALPLVMMMKKFALKTLQVSIASRLASGSKYYSNNSNSPSSALPSSASPSSSSSSSSPPNAESSKQPFLWDSNSIRQSFIEYFVKEHGHTFVPSSSVLPNNDPSLVMVNSGMNQFKPIILGQPGHQFGCLKRAVNSQKCIRCGGKHNDLSDVGKDYRHHTFFEMLGNWSFGDYYKDEAIKMAWDLLVNRYKLPKDRLFVTYFSGDDSLNLQPDLESKSIWRSLLAEYNLSEDKIIGLGADENFWEMGTTGPCGPCSEIHFIIDPIKAKSDLMAGSIELWNLVFMQYQRMSSGELLSLPQKHVDTGMGLERLASVLLTEKQNSNYDTDLFAPLIAAIEDHAPNAPRYTGSLDSNVDFSYRLIADHARMYTVAISDGILPATSGSGHKVRSVIRSAYWTARSVFEHQAALLLVKLVDEVVKSLGDAYPNLKSQQQLVKDEVYKECKVFYKSTSTAKQYFKKKVKQMKADGVTTLSGSAAFEFVKKFGAPVSLLESLATRYEVQIDWDSFDEIVKKEREISMAGSSKEIKSQ